MNPNNDTPSIRFAGFTDAWGQRKLGEVAPLRGGYAFQSSHFKCEGIPIVKISNILQNGEVGGDFDYYDEISSDENVTLPDGAAVLAMSGATTGKVSILSNKEKKKIYQNQRVGYFSPCENIAYSFIQTITRSHLFTEQLKSVLVAGAQPNVSSKDIDNFEFYFPTSIFEQSRIGAFLTEIDSLITLHQRKYDQLVNIKKSMLEKMFPKNGELVPEVRFAGFTDAWEQREVGELLTERNEQSPKSEDYPLMAFIAYEGVAPKGERYDRSSLVNDTENKLYKHTEKGDFIYSSNNLETGSIGLNNYGNACISPVYSIFSCTELSIPDFIGRRLCRKDFISEMVKWRQGVIYGQWRIHEDDFVKIKIEVPTVQEQKKIGQLLLSLDTLTTLHQRKLERLQNIKKACLEKMFV